MKSVRAHDRHTLPPGESDLVWSSRTVHLLSCRLAKSFPIVFARVIFVNARYFATVFFVGVARLQQWR